eukprot:458621-Prorocentrum_lima.AAC.1
MSTASSSCSSSTAFRRLTTKPRKERERNPGNPFRRQARHWSKSSCQIHLRKASSFSSLCRYSERLDE